MLTYILLKTGVGDIFGKWNALGICRGGRYHYVCGRAGGEDKLIFTTCKYV